MSHLYNIHPRSFGAMAQSKAVPTGIFTGSPSMFIHPASFRLRGTIRSAVDEFAFATLGED